MAQTLDPAAKPAPTVRLSLMMFLQYAVWGAWLPQISRYMSAPVALDAAGHRTGGLGFSNEQIGMIAGAAGAVGALTAPFIAGQIADRYFSAERFLCVLMLLGGIVKFISAGLYDYNQWLWMTILYSILFMPTIAISNGLAFSHLTNPQKQFPPIRMWGTIGWIVVSWVFPMVWLKVDLHPSSLPPFLTGTDQPDVIARLADALRLSGIISISYAIYCLLCLPHTPPKKSVEPLAFAKAFGLWTRNPGLLVLTLIALPIAALHTIYYASTGQFLASLGVAESNIAPAQTVSQFSEFLFLGILGYILKKVGFKWTLAIGALAYFARYAAFAVGTPLWFVIASQACHGFCFACFYATAFIYVERVAPSDVRHSAQTVFAIVLLGVGPLLVAPLLSFMTKTATVDGTLDYSRFWWIASFIGLACFAVHVLLFRIDPEADKSADPASA